MYLFVITNEPNIIPVLENTSTNLSLLPPELHPWCLVPAPQLYRQQVARVCRASLLLQPPALHPHARQLDRTTQSSPGKEWQVGRVRHSRAGKAHGEKVRSNQKQTKNRTLLNPEVSPTHSGNCTLLPPPKKNMFLLIYLDALLHCNNIVWIVVVVVVRASKLFFCQYPMQIADKWEGALLPSYSITLARANPLPYSTTTCSRFLWSIPTREIAIAGDALSPLANDNFLKWSGDVYIYTYYLSSSIYVTYGA